MAKIKKKTGKKNSKIKIQKGVRKGFMSRVKFTESYTSLILGAIVVIVIGILFISSAMVNKNTQTSSINDTSNDQNSSTSSTYTVNPGDDLWTISETIYNDGYSWVAIARANKLENPGLIYPGTKLMIPVIISTSGNGKTTPQINEQNPQTQNSIIQNNSITGNSYTVVLGDNLWNIAVRAYGDGFKWPEIARANNLVNPSLIHPGNFFIIPR